MHPDPVLTSVFPLFKLIVAHWIKWNRIGKIWKSNTKGTKTWKRVKRETKWQTSILQIGQKWHFSKLQNNHVAFPPAHNTQSLSFTSVKDEPTKSGTWLQIISFSTNCFLIGSLHPMVLWKKCAYIIEIMIPLDNIIIENIAKSTADPGI